MVRKVDGGVQSVFGFGNEEDGRSRTSISKELRDCDSVVVGRGRVLDGVKEVGRR